MNGPKVGAIIAAAIAAGLGSDLLARCVIRRHEDLDPETMRLPGSRFWVRGTAVHYIERGSGFPVVLIHGFGGSTFSYRYTIPALAKQFRVLAIDLPGFGYSDRGAVADYSQTGWANLIAEFLERQGVERAVIIGHSLGGGVAQRLAILQPSLVERLVLVSSVTAARRQTGAGAPVIAPIMRGVQAAIVARPGLVHPMARRIAYDPAFMSAEVLDGYLRPTRVIGSAAAMRRIAKHGRRDGIVDISKIEAPALLIWGERDRAVKLAVGRELQRNIPHACLEIVPNAGHLPLEEHPELCNRLIFDFIGDLAGPREPASRANS